MKTLKVLVGTLLSLPIALLSVANSDALEKNHNLPSTIKHGENGQHGCNGQDGENGQHGRNGQDGENGGNGGHGGNSDWGRGGNGGDGGNSLPNPLIKQTDEQADEWEYKILKDICRQIIDETISQSNNLSPVSKDQNTLEKQLKQNISHYLIQINTPAAEKLWKEYENIEWSYPAIAAI